MKPAAIAKRKGTQPKQKASARVRVVRRVKKSASSGGPLEGDPTVTIAASVPRSVASAAKRRAGAGNFSRFVTSALQHELSLEALDELVEGFVADGGKLDEAEIAAARKLITR